MAGTVVITGANRGIGLGLARLFLEGGDAVVATARRPEQAAELRRLAGEFPRSLRVEALSVDSDRSVGVFVKGLTNVAEVDLLVNNAGVYLDRDRGLEELPLEVFPETCAVNALGPVRVTRALLPWLERARRPVVAHMTSKLGSIAANETGGYYAYRMSKAALNAFSKSFSVDFPRVISVVLHPGWVRTAMGTQAAPLSVEESAAGLYRVIRGLTPGDSGRFLDHRGEPVPW